MNSPSATLPCEPVAHPEVEAFLNRLTLRELIGQTCQGLAGEIVSKDDPAAHLAAFPYGSVFAGREIIRGERLGCHELRAALDRLQSASRIPLGVAGDLEAGAGIAVSNATRFPSPMALAATRSPELAYEYGKWTAIEARRAGYNWTFSPVADLSLNWLNPAVGTRSFGSSPRQVAVLLDAIIRGLQDHGLAATAKHFPGDGVDFRDQHLCTVINALEPTAWRESFGRTFGAAIRAGVRSIMAGHIALPWMDPTCGPGGRPIPATLSHPILSGLLREEMGFKGVIVSDALIMAGFTGWGPRRKALVQAFLAGIDVLLWPGDDYFDLMNEAIERGEVPLGRVRESARRVLEFKAAIGLLDGPEPEPPAEASREAAVLARRIATLAPTLVRNRRGLLPLGNSVHSALVLLATARPESAEAKMEPFLHALRQRGIKPTLHVNGNCMDIRNMEESGHSFDAFFCLFDQQMHEVKNSLRPAGPAAECLWTLQNTETLDPVIISLGSPYLLHDMPHAETLINAYSPDPTTLAELVPALFGENSFHGVSPVGIEERWVSPTLCSLPEGCVTDQPSANPAPPASAPPLASR